MKKYLLSALAVLFVFGGVVFYEGDEYEGQPTSEISQSTDESGESISQSAISAGIRAKQGTFEAADPEYPDEEKIIYALDDGAFDPELHPADAQLWDIIKTLAPTDSVLESVKEFIVYYDTEDTTLASVAAIDNINSEWSFEINYIAAEEFEELAPTIVHEFAHILSLQNAQTTTPIEEEGITDSCGNLLLAEGCLNDESYLDTFYELFWENTENYIGDTDRDEDEALSFFEDRQDSFVTDYAATNVVEDFAESFRAYVMEEPVDSDQTKDQKTNFFSNYSELTTYRTKVRTAISAWTTQN
jgi:hypothetical protein